MKVEQSKRTGVAAIKRSKSASREVNSSFESLLVPETEIEAIATTARISNVDALVSVQEIAGDGKNNSGTQKRAAKILDRLDDIRTGLLLGQIPRENLQNLSELLKVAREEAIDSGLEEILDDIELRARVELAKLDAKSP